MFKRYINKFKFNIERLMLRGARFQLLFIAVILVLISLVAGIIVLILTSTFTATFDSIWWAFLRLTDPGYLGDDQGVVLRIVSTIVTIMGYVLFMGALIAILTQWLHSYMRKLESGLTPITQNNHFLILGWTNRTPTIIREIILSEGRVKRFLRRIGAKGLHIVILAEEVSTRLMYELREELGKNWNQKHITFRSGTPLRIEHLRRVDFTHAGVIILPGADFASEGSELIDTITIKSLLSISNYGASEIDNELPLVVAEIFDGRKIPIAKSAYQGKLELIASDSVISRLIAQNVRHQGLSYIYTELLTHNEGNEIYVRDLPQFTGVLFQNIFSAFSRAIPLGVIRKNADSYMPILNPPDGFQIELGDRLVVMAHNYHETEPMQDFKHEEISRGQFKTKANIQSKRKILILGWNLKLPALIREFDSYENEAFEIDILSLVQIDQREEYFSRHDVNKLNINLSHVQGDYTASSDLQRVHPEKYDNIIFIGNSWLDSNEESDARTILGYHILREMLPHDSSKPEVLIELMDPENERLFHHRRGEVLISPLILSHILAHVALRRELNAVFDELFTVGGAEIYIRPAETYGIVDCEMSFQEISRMVLEHGDILLGVKQTKEVDSRNGGIHLNPSHDSQWNFNATDGLVVLTIYG